MWRKTRFGKGFVLAAYALLMLGALLVAAALFPVGSGHKAQASSVQPEFLAGATNQGKTCSDLQGPGQTWTEFKLEDGNLSNGPHTQGPLTVTISNLDGDSFDWASNIGVDAVVVKGGAEGSNLYRYDPPTESTGDTDLGVPNPENNGISHISFCYDEEVRTPTPSPTATATPTPTPSPTATATPSPTATATPSPTATATPSPTATATPSPTATATPSPTATATPSPTATATPSPTVTATPMAMPTVLPEVETPLPTPAPSLTFTPTATPAAQPVAAPGVPVALPATGGGPYGPGGGASVGLWVILFLGSAGALLSIGVLVLRGSRRRVE